MNEAFPQIGPNFVYIDQMRLGDRQARNKDKEDSDSIILNVRQ